MPYLKAIKGISIAYTTRVVGGDGKPLLNVFDGSEVINGYAWPGDDQAQAFLLSVAWQSGPLGTITNVIPAASTADQIPGVYNWIIQRTDNSMALAIGNNVNGNQIKLEGVPGSGLPGLPDLATLPYVQSALTEMTLNMDQVDFLPYALNDASQHIRRACQDRDFTLTTYTRDLEVTLDGTAMIPQIPVQQVLRVQTNPTTALSIFNATAQIATVAFSYTGDVTGQGAVGQQTVTGLVLDAIVSGVETVTPVLFTTNQTIGSLATAINAVGNGWSCEVEDEWGGWPVTELVGGYEAKGCTDSLSADLKVWGTVLHNTQCDRRTGLLACGRQFGGPGPMWGPGYEMFEPDEDNYGLVRVKWIAGFPVIPPMLQRAVAETTKAILERFRTDSTLQSERMGDYQYAVREVVGALPMSVLQTISYYRLHPA